MALGVTSEPVPAVVGMSTIGSAGFFTFSIPRNSETDQSLVILAASNLVISRELPPPIPMSTW